MEAVLLNQVIIDLRRMVAMAALLHKLTLFPAQHNSNPMVLAFGMDLDFGFTAFCTARPAKVKCLGVQSQWVDFCFGKPWLVNYAS